MNPSYCPNCASDDILFKPKTSFWKCDSCNHEWKPIEERSSLRIFLSYGRDEFAVVAERICRDLEGRGHKIWFDINILKTGGDWEQYIEDGLKWAAEEPSTGRIVFVMTPHSVRRPDGYCLNEIALGISKNLPIIPVMLVWSEPPLSIYRLQYLDMRGTYRHGENQIVEGIYETKLENLAEALVHKKIDLDVGHSHMLKVLEPINFSADVFKLQKDFTGRQWVFAQLDRWLTDPEASKLFWVTGAPGSGKSAIAAYVRDNYSQVVAYHFCDAASDEKRSPTKLVLSVACQLASQLPVYQKRLCALDLATIKQEYSAPNSANTLFDKLVVQPLSDNFPEPNRTLVVIIDALDEATVSGKNEIVRFLRDRADKTPKWLRFLITSRPEQEVLVPLQTYKPFMLDTDGQNNREDLTTYLKSKLLSVTDEQLDFILEKSEGVFLYVKQVCEEITRGNLSLERLDAFPRGLGGIYEQFFERQFGAGPAYYQREIIPLLYFVLAAQESLTLGLVKTLRGWVNNNELFSRLDKLGALFPRTGESDNDTLRPFHKSVTDWLSLKASSGSWYIDTAYGHKLLADAGWKQFVSGPETMSSYFLTWLPEHLKRSSENAKLVELLKSFRFMMERLRFGALEQSLLDYRSLKPKLISELKSEQAFYRERSHLLRRHTDEWPTYKILLQLAVEHADNSPLTLGAEAWLAAGHCDWKWIRRMQRVDTAGVDPCLTVLEGHTGGVEGVLERHDGTLISWSYDKTLRLWGRDGDPLKVLVGHTHIVWGVLETTYDTLLSWSDDGTLRLWSSDGDPLKVLVGHTHIVQGVIETTYDTLLSWSDDDSTLRLWSRDGDPLKVLKGHTGMVKGVFERTDGTLVSWSSDKTLRLWSRDGDPLKVLKGHTGMVKGVFERADSTLVSCSDDGTLRLWSREGEPFKVLKGHTGSVFGVRERPDGTLMSWSSDRTLRLWRLDGEHPKVLEGHTGSVNGILERSDGTLLSWAEDGTLILWSREGDLLKVLRGHTGAVLGVLERPDGTLVSWAGGFVSQDNTLRLWSRDGDPLKVLAGHTGSVLGVHERPDGTLLSWSEDGTLRLWNSDRDPLKVLEGHTSKVTGVLERTDGTLLSWVGSYESQDNTLRLWSREGDTIKVLEGHTGTVWDVLERADGTLVSCSDDGTLRLWGRDGDPFKVLKGHTGSVFGVRERPDGTLVSYGSYGDDNLRLWSCNGEPLKMLEGHTGSLKGVLVRSDGTLLSWSGDETLRLWSREGDPLKVLEGHTGMVEGVLERTDSTILSWSRDNTLRLWSRDGDPLKVLEGHTGSVYGVLERADGTLVSWARQGDANMRLWSCNGEPLKMLEGHTGSLKGVLVRSDGTLLSWSSDRTLRLWSREGDPLKVLKGHTGVVNGVHERADGTFLSWAGYGDDTLRLWSREGDPLKVFSDYDGEHGYFEQASDDPRTVGNHYLGAGARVCLIRFNGVDVVERIIWQPLAQPVSRRLYADGRMYVTQDNGQVCFLQLYSGNQPIGLEI